MASSHSGYNKFYRGINLSTPLTLKPSLKQKHDKSGPYKKMLKLVLFVLVIILIVLFFFVSMRVFWMRLIWTATAISYLIIVIYYRKCMFENTGDPKYEDKPAWVGMLGVICFEYLTLGMLECTMKITNSEMIREKIHRSTADLPIIWQRLCNLSYHVCVFAYAIRNFSMSLYFGLLSVGVSEDSSDYTNPFTGLTLVLQIYLTIIRGRFYGFFMHGFLSTFLVEEDDPIFDKARVKSDDVNNDSKEGIEKRFLKEQCQPNVGYKLNESRYDSIV